MTSHKINLWDNEKNESEKLTKKVDTEKATKKVKNNILKKILTVKEHVTPNQIVEKKAQEIIASREHVKRKRWGLRHAIYAFIFAVILQTAVSIPMIIVTIANQMNTSGTNIDETSVTQALLSPQNLFILQLSTYIGWFAVGLWASYRLGVHSIAKDFWFRLGKRYSKPVNWLKDIGLGLLIAVGVRALELLLFWIFELLNLDMAGADNGSVFMQGNGFWTYMLLFGIVSLAGPIAEEFLFRGMLLQGLLRNFNKRTFVPKTSFGQTIDKTAPQIFNAYVAYKNFLYKHKYVAAVLISGIAFGLMHFQGLETFGQIWVVVETGFIGILFALVALRTKRLGIVIAAHCFFNLSGVILSLLS